MLHRMSVRRLVLAASLALSACSSGPSTNEKIKDYADKICACKDYACARPLWTEFLGWMSKRDGDKQEEKAPDLDRLMACARTTGAL